MREGKPELENRIVSHNSGDYKRNRLEETFGNDHVHAGNCFGLTHILKAIGLSKGKKEILKLDPAEWLKDSGMLSNPALIEVARELKELLIQKSKISGFQMPIEEFLRETGEGDLENGFFVSRSKDKNTKEEIKLDDIPDKVFLKMLFLHFVIFTEKTEEFKKREVKLRKQFLKSFQSSLIQGVFEAEFSNIIGKVNNVEVHISDILTEESPDLHGLAIHDSDTIHIATPLPVNYEAQVYYHEMLHAVSGISAMLTNPATQEVDSSGLMKTTGKVKVRRKGINMVHEGVLPLNNLNEAVTQYLTLVIFNLPREKNIIYTEEIELWENLCKRGKNLLPKKLFYNAYFEDSGTGGKTASPKMQVMFDAVDESYGKKNFLVRLGEYIKKNGVVSATEALKKNPDEI